MKFGCDIMLILIRGFPCILVRWNLFGCSLIMQCININIYIPLYVSSGMLVCCQIQQLSHFQLYVLKTPPLDNVVVAEEFW